MSSGRGKQQATSLARPGETRWGSHYKTLLCIESMWDAAIEVLEIVHQDECNPSDAGGLVEKMECFSFVFNMKMCRSGFTTLPPVLLQEQPTMFLLWARALASWSLTMDECGGHHNLRGSGRHIVIPYVTPTFYKNKFFCANRGAYKNAY
jgi:hypothetical protein